MKSFRYLKVNSTAAAESVLSDQKGRARVLAGGTDILGALKDDIHFEYPEMLLDLKGLDELAYIEESEKGIRIGTLTRLSQIQTDSRINSGYRLLSEAAKAVASPQIRNVATIGGNICQETRCWYYRFPENGFPCLRKGGKVCNALTGENQFHSIYGPVRVETTPCSAACPGGVEIAEYMERLREGDYAGAAKILLGANPLPSITGRVCPHSCEGGCNRGDYDQPVSIRGVERFLGDYILDNAEKFISVPEAETGKSVAVVGSGPGGLSAAYYLRKAGHRVHVFDRNERAGGMLAYSIPNYRLPQKLVDRIVDAFASAGVQFKLGVNIGSDIRLTDLKRKYDAVLLATGAWVSASAGFDGEELSVPALEFLMSAKRGRKDLSGRKVVVIGGGNVAVDSAVTARRSGAKEVTIVCLESREEMPALEWEIDEAVEENVKLMTSWGPARIIGAEARVIGLELKRCVSVFDEEGRFSPQFDEPVRRSLDADIVILAVGQRPEISYVSPELETAAGRIVVDPATQATSIQGIFAGGDNTSGPATVIAAIAAGRRAAVSIDCFLKNSDTECDPQKANEAQRLLRFDPSCFEESNRAHMPCRPVMERNMDSEDSLGFSSPEIESEAKRCFNCGCVAANPSDIAPALIALDARIKTTTRTVMAENFFMACPKGSTILEAGELVTEIQIPRLRPGTRQGYRKFRIRQSIDFPIVSLASVFVMHGSEIEDARLVVGAAAPVPLRLVPVEDFLKGKKITERLAGEAAEIAVRQATPLRKNDYKIKVTKALVRAAVFELLQNPIQPMGTGSSSCRRSGVSTFPTT